MTSQEETLDLFDAAARDGTDDGLRRVWTVSELNAAVRTLLEEGLPPLWVSGEVANWTRARSGHCYFTLKDETAQLRCVLFRGDARNLPVDPEEGMRLRVFGAPSLYEARGDFQLIARAVQDEEGEGLWRVAFERVRKKLEEEGLLAASRKRPLPAFPAAVGVVTSTTGAAIRDILTVLARRAPWTRVVVRGTRVQGREAADEVARAVDVLGSSGEVDLLIVGRGGGSVEDLWAFNEEPVARAVAGCPVPVISAVGHESDVTISDLVADLRAPTPSAAAEAAVPDRASLISGLRELGPRLDRGLRNIHRERARGLRELRHRVSRVAREVVEPRQREVAQQRDRLERSMHDLLERGRRSVAVVAGRIEALSPLGTLKRGYAVPLTPSGTVLRSVEDFRSEDPFVLRVVDGRVRCKPLGVDPEEEPS